MEKTVFGYVWQYSRQQQIIMTLMSAASLPFLYLYYEVPKTIINQAIQGIGIEYPLNISKKLTFSAVGLEIPLLGPFDLIIEQTPYLFILCAVFLILSVNYLHPGYLRSSKYWRPTCLAQSVAMSLLLL